MSGNSIIGAILVVVGIVFGIAGYNKSQPSAEEKFGSFALSLGDIAGHDNKEGVENIKSRQFKRALPFYAIGCIAGIVGIVLLKQSTKS